MESILGIVRVAVAASAVMLTTRTIVSGGRMLASAGGSLLHEKLSDLRVTGAGLS